VNYLVSDLLKIHTPHHTQIQRQITDYFARCGYESRTEKEACPEFAEGSGGTEKAGWMCSPKRAVIRSGLKLIIAQSG